MAAFDRDAVYTHPIDFQILQNTFVSKFADKAFLDATLSRLTELAYQTVTLDARSWATAREMYQDFTEELALPDCPTNLDALADYFRDVAMWEIGTDDTSTGLALVLEHYDSFASKDPKTAHALLDIFAVTARTGALVGHRMMCLVQSDDPTLEFPPIGATRAEWASGFWPWPD